MCVVIHIKWPKVIIIAIVVSFAMLTTVFFAVIRQNDSSEKAITTFKEQSAKDTLLVCVFLEAIREESYKFYAPYYTLSPTIAYYSATVKGVKEYGANIDITFMSLPYIGPHDTIGEDEITFRVTHSGEITPREFRHVKSYPLPSNLSDIQIALPPVVE